MRAREWTIASTYGSPAEYNIPDLPAWRVCRAECGRLELAGDDEEAFIAADCPVAVRR